MESELRHRLQIVEKVQNWTRPHAGQRMESRPVSKVIKYSISLCRTQAGVLLRLPILPAAENSQHTGIVADVVGCNKNSEKRKGDFLNARRNRSLLSADAHLKNFGVVYDDVLGEARLAPVYDLVTTSVYLPKDKLALTLNGTTRWPTAKELQRLGETRGGLSPSQVRRIFEQIADAMESTSAEIREYIKDNTAFGEIGERMLQEWGNSWDQW